MKLSSENQRMWDLVRQCRGTLHMNGYITDAEHDLLASDGAAVKRLEDYDAAVARLEFQKAVKEQEAKTAAAGAYLAAAEVIKKRIESTEIGTAACSGTNCAGCELARMGEAVRKLTPANAERSLQVYAQERVVEEIEWWHPRTVTFGLTWQDQENLDRLAAATARLAELKK